MSPNLKKMNHRLKLKLSTSSINALQITLKITTGYQIHFNKLNFTLSQSDLLECKRIDAFLQTYYLVYFYVAKKRFYWVKLAHLHPKAANFISAALLIA